MTMIKVCAAEISSDSNSKTNQLTFSHPRSLKSELDVAAAITAAINHSQDLGWATRGPKHSDCAEF